jgi:gliding motility-associated-like protein
MYYEYIGPGNQPSSAKYRVGLNLYMVCTANQVQINKTVSISVYTGDNSDQFFQFISIPLQTVADVENCDSCDKCINNKPSICYKYCNYETEVELPISSSGYLMGYQLCCRVSGLINMVNSSAIGDTWTIKIPGTNTGATAYQNASPSFVSNDTALICADSYFTFDFNASDPDGDKLVYSFAPAYRGGVGVSPTYATPPYISVPYSSLFSGSEPLGPGVTMDPATGRVSGIAPPYIGEYVITAVAKEYRNGMYIGESRKSLHVQVASCSKVDAYLVDDNFCEGLTKTFKNVVPSPPGATYEWDFGVPGITTDVSNSISPIYTYQDTGTYKVSLVIKLNNCIDSSSAYVKVYPGIFPDFTFTIPCSNIPVQFSDKTNSGNSIVNKWTWNFDDTASGTSNISSLQNPGHTFKNTGTYDISLTVSNTQGCVNTIVKPIIILENPAINISGDTLICNTDTLQLNAGGNGNFTWTPAYNISNQFIASPLVSPDIPTRYYVTVVDPSGCKAYDSVFIDVRSFVTVDAGRDTGICTGQSIQLTAISDAMFFSWSPSSTLNDGFLKNPMATPATTTKYYVTGNIGKCTSTDSVLVRVGQYPGNYGMPDTVVCSGMSVQLNAGGGSIFSWSPVFFLNDPHISNPVAGPDRDIIYTVSIRDTLGCPAMAWDTVLIRVLSMKVDAGPRDTSIVVNQPLQLNATGGQVFLWSPASGLSNAGIANPVATLLNNMDYVVTSGSTGGCIAKDTISVKVFNVLPGIYLPNGFTPNGDGLNDYFKPEVIGIKRMNYFKVFNRGGIEMFSTTSLYNNPGWNGTYKGKPQEAAVYTWIAEGTDHLDKKIRQKGIVMLLR